MWLKLIIKKRIELLVGSLRWALLNLKLVTYLDFTDRANNTSDIYALTGVFPLVKRWMLHENIVLDGKKILPCGSFLWWFSVQSTSCLRGDLKCGLVHKVSSDHGCPLFGMQLLGQVELTDSRLMAFLLRLQKMRVVLLLTWFFILGLCSAWIWFLFFIK